MANGRQPSIKIDLPLDGNMLKQNLFGALGGPVNDPIGSGQGPLAPGQQLTPAGIQPEPQVSPDITDQPGRLVAQSTAPTANFPEPQAAAPAPQATQTGSQSQSSAQLLQSQLDSPQRQEIMQRLQEAVARGQEQRGQSISGLEDLLSAEQAKGPDKALAIQKALANFSDAFFDTNISKNVPLSESQQARATRIAQLQRAISQEKGSLNKQEIDALKAQLGNKDAQRLMQSLGRDRRFQQSQDKAFEFNRRQRRKDLGKELNKSGIPGLEVTFGELNSVVPGGLEAFTGQQIPGIGGAESLKTPNLLSPEGRRNRRLALSLGNQFLKARSGAQINEQEAQRIMKELGFDVTLSENGKIVSTTFTGAQSSEDFVNGVRQAKAAVDATKDVLRLTHGQDVFDELNPALVRAAQKRINVKQEAAPKKKLTEADLDKMTTEQLEAFIKGK